MSKSSSSEHKYKVGPGNPPKHSRFKPGQSGNPKGRPKGRATMRTVVERELAKTIVINENGKLKRITKLEMLARSLINSSIKGDHKLVDLLIRYFIQSNDTGSLAAEELSTSDPALLRRVKARLDRILSDE